MNILVVDDDNLTRTMFSELLSKDGHITTAVGSGNEALAKMKNSIFDFAIVDLKMPGISGIDVLREIKIRNPATEVIIITGYGTVDTAVEAMKRGAYDFIEKPFKFKKIQGLIKDLSTTRKKESGKIQILQEPYHDLLKTGDFTDIFKKYKEPRKGLYVTTEISEKARTKYDKFNISYIEIGQLKPTDALKIKLINDVSNKIHRFVRDNKNSLLLIDCFDIFIRHQTWNTIKQFIMKIYDELLRNNSEMIISVDANGIYRKNLEQLVRIIYEANLNIGLDSLSSPLEIEIVDYLSRNEGSSFNSILKNINTDQSSKLSFHLQKLTENGVVQKSNKKYNLEPKGVLIVNTLRLFESIEVHNYHNPLSMIYNRVGNN
jgi:DNA-binding response OmpR family regulator/predicted transcriptional regulator